MGAMAGLMMAVDSVLVLVPGVSPDVPVRDPDVRVAAGVRSEIIVPVSVGGGV